MESYILWEYQFKISGIVVEWAASQKQGSLSYKLSLIVKQGISHENVGCGEKNWVMSRFFTILIVCYSMNMQNTSNCSLSS
jgi:hypothetical protein